jgi:Zn-dependent metalloprotease
MASREESSGKTAGLTGWVGTRQKPYQINLKYLITKLINNIQLVIAPTGSIVLILLPKQTENAMTLISRLPQKFLSLLLGASMLLTLFQPLSVQAQEDGLRRGRDPQTGLLTFLGADPAKPYRLPSAMQAGLLADQRAHALLELFAPEFGITNPGRDLRLAREKAGEDGQSSLRYQQVFQDIPVMGGELVVNTTAEGALLSMSGEASLVRDLITQPAIGREQARAAALQLMQRNYSAQPSEFELTEPQLWILDERLLRPSSQPPVLVWRLEASLLEGPVRELILVNALDGGIPLHFNQIDTAWTSRGGKPASFARPALPDRLPSRSLVAGTPLYSTYDLNHGTTLPGTLKCTEANPTCSGAVLDAQWAHFLAADAYDFYYTQHGRDSLDNHGLRIKSTVRYKVNYDNAFWNGTQMAYGDAYGFVFADDVVGHELTHGVTDYESDLFYYYQSGAINESFSDVWGEAFDQLNGVGTDDLASKWYIGEDVSGYGALRHMSNPGL